MLKRLAIIFAAVLALALGCAWAGMWEQGRQNATAAFDAPGAPAPQFLKSTAGFSGPAFLPAERPAQSAGIDVRFRIGIPPGEPHRPALLEFTPLYRRPPPASF